MKMKDKPASKHGFVRAVDTHFEFEDGTVFHPFGTTVYALAHQKEELVEQTLKTLEASPFNKVRMCVFPKHYTYNHNDPLVFPFEKRGDGSWAVEKPVPAFWDNLDRIIGRLDEMGIQCDLILFHPYDCWGFIDMPQADNLTYIDYVVERLGHHKNIWWSVANEYDLCLGCKTMEDWYEIEEHLAAKDRDHHLLSCHNCFVLWDHHREAITHGSIQNRTIALVADQVAEYKKPIMVDECCYEGNIPDNWGCISAQEMTARFWEAIVSGAYCTHGETYLDENDVLWWAKGGILKGESPERIGWLKELVDTFPRNMEPITDEITGIANMPQEQREEMENSPMFKGFMAAMGRMSDADRMVGTFFEKNYAGCIGKDLFLYYYEHHCNALANIALPPDGSYTVEVLDTWNMTRKTVMTHVCGNVSISLPGKEYMAILATREK